MDDKMTEENLFDALTEQEKGALITAAIQFKSVITELFGDEYSEEAFNKIADLVLPSLKYEMLKNALTGKYSYSLFVSVNSAPHYTTGGQYNKVTAIKAIRSYNDGYLGLKEAKDICDNAESNIVTKVRVKTLEDRNKLLAELNAAGVNAS